MVDKFIFCCSAAYSLRSCTLPVKSTMADAMLAKQKDDSVSSPNTSSTGTSRRSSKKLESDDSKKSYKKASDKKDIKSSSKKVDTHSRSATASVSSESLDSNVKVPESRSIASVSMASETQDVSLGDIMSCLMGIKNDQAKCNNRLNDLAGKVDELYEYNEYDEMDCEEGSDIDAMPDNNVPVNTDKPSTSSAATSCANPTVTDDNNNEPPNKVQKVDNDSMFKTINDKFKIKEKVDKPVDDELASMVNNLFREGIPEEQLSSMVKNIHRPENCEALTKTRVNQLIWHLLKDTTKSEENRIQYKQNILIKASCLITQLLNELNTLKKEKNIDVPQDVIYLGTDALGLLGHCNRLINLHRREMHKPDLNFQYQHLASSATPFTSLLYGDDVSKNVSDIDSVNKVGNKIRRFKFGYIPRGYFRRGRGRPGFRGSRVEAEVES